MEICKNKTSGKTFIYLDDDDNDRALLVTPQGEIKSLELKLFSDFAEEQDEQHLLSSGLITDAQYVSYKNYKVGV